MATATVEPRGSGLVPAPAAFLGFLALGVLAILALPGIADDLPHPGRIEQAQYALTCLGVLVATSVYVCTVARTQPVLDLAWISWTLLYGAGLVIVKFILSPTAFQKSSGTSLDAFVTSGMLVMPLYIAAFVFMYRLADRRGGNWLLSSRFGVASGLAIVAVTTRLVVALILGTASEYLDGLVGTGLVLPLVVATASFAVMNSYESSGPALKSALRVGIGLIVGQHLLWVTYMYRLFS
jgi:hypothetical protein